MNAFFVVVAVYFVGCIVLRFDELAAHLPAGLSPGLLWAAFPLLLIMGLFDARADEAERGKPAKAAFAFGFTFLAVVLVQTWGLKIGPFDPSPPKSFDTATRARFFLTFSVGFVFPFWLASKSLLVPPLRGLGKLVSPLPGPLAGLVLGLAGLVIGAGVVAVLASVAAGQGVKDLSAAWKTFTERPVIAMVTGFGGVLVPLAWGEIKKRLTGEGQRPTA